MNVIRKSLLVIAAGLIALNANATESVILNTPANFHVLSISPNGKWSCGNFVDAANESYAFRWNLESGSIEMLGNQPSIGWGVSNDGTVSGEFKDYEVTDNNIPVSMVGYWRDGEWHHVEMPAGDLSYGIAGGISPDGRYMSGSVCINGVCTAFIWEEGKIIRKLTSGNHGVSYAIAPDGKSAAGWFFKKNRVATYWGPDATVYFEDSPNFSATMYNCAKNFSGDGSKLVYWGGWDVDDNGDNWLWCWYDVTTGTHHKVKAPSCSSDLEFFGISNDGMMVGSESNRGFVQIGDKGMYLDDYLESIGVDISKFSDFFKGDDYYVGQLPVNVIVNVSADGKTMVMRYYNTIGAQCSLALKIDPDFSAVSPAEVTANQLDGLSTVGLNWKRPVGANNIRGYNIYRNGTKLNGFLPINLLYYYDRNLTPGNYTYEVSAVTTAGVETKADAIEIEVKATDAAAPYQLFCRRKGINNAYLSWNAPLSNLAHRRYFDLETQNTDAFVIYMPLTVEVANRFDKVEMANYAGMKISEVTFMPMAAQNSWTLNFYTIDDAENLTILASQPITQPLDYKQFNTVKLTNPIDLPANDLIVALEVEVTNPEGGAIIASQLDKSVPGYSDLLRRKEDTSFISTYESSLETGYSISCNSWLLDLGLQASDAILPEVEHFNIYVDNTKVATTTSTSHVFENIEDGHHTLGVVAQYSDGASSPLITTDFDMVGAYLPVSDVTIDTGKEGSSTVKASWNAPLDDDLTVISYTRASKHASGIIGNESTGYALMAGAQYPASMFRGYNGYKINTVKFYPLADALYTFIIFEDGKEIFEYEVDQFNLKQWNEYTLPEEITIKEGCSYHLIVDCFDPEPNVPVLAIDNSVPLEYYSDLVSINNGDSWSSATIESGTSGNWMIGFTIVTPNAKPAAISGYDVVIDGSARYNATLTDTSFTYDLGANDAKRHSLAVNAYYNGKTEPCVGTTHYFYLGSGGIDSAEITDITLVQGVNTLLVEGDGVLGISLLNTAGVKVAEAMGNTIELTNIASGIYLVQVTLNDSTLTRKISIKR